MKSVITHVVAASTAVALAFSLQAAPTPPPGFEAAFNGKDLSGWFGYGGEDPRPLFKATPEELAKIHADFMNDPTATDVITFAGDTAAGLAGEICVSADTAARFIQLKLSGARTARRPAKLTAGPTPFAERRGMGRQRLTTE